MFVMVRGVGLVLWHSLSSFDRRRLAQWYSFRKHKLTVLTLCGCAGAYLIYRSWTLTPGICTLVHGAVFFTFIHMLPAEQLLMLILYTMTLPVYLSNMPVDTLARELSEWGKEMSSHPTDDDDHWFEALCSHINKTTSDAIRRRFRPRKGDQGSIRTQRIEVAGASPKNKTTANEDSPFFSLLSTHIATEPAVPEMTPSESESTSLSSTCSVRVGGVMGCIKREAAAAGFKTIRLSEATTI